MTVPGIVIELTMVCEGIIAVPIKIKPVIPEVAVAVQLNVVPGTVDVRITGAVAVPEQIVWVSTELLTDGIGYIVTT